jgi:propanediol dehydratase large subunit
MNQGIDQYHSMNKSLFMGLLLIMIFCVISILYTQCASHNDDFETQDTYNRKKPLPYYIPSSQFVGARKGYVFKTENFKTGYYKDTNNGM